MIGLKWSLETIAKLVNMTPISMLYACNHEIDWGYKPKCKWGGPCNKMDFSEIGRSNPHKDIKVPKIRLKKVIDRRSTSFNSLRGCYVP